MRSVFRKLLGWSESPSKTVNNFQTITSKQQVAASALQQSELRFDQLVAGVRDYAVFLLDAQGRVASWNIGAERIKGYAASEIIGQHFSRFYRQEAIASGWPTHELRVASETGRFEDEGWRIRKDGSEFWANVVITAVRDQQGELVGFLKITRDLTERRQAEENARRLLVEEAARRAAEANMAEAQIATSNERREREQLRATLASIGDAVIATDENGNVTFLNPVAELLTEWTAQEAAGEPLERVFKIINEETRSPVENPVSRVFRENVVVGLANHTALVSKRGKETPIEDCAAPIHNVDGSIGGAVLVFRDVTEARRALEAKLHLAAIVASSNDAIIGQSLEGIIVSWNNAAERLYGYSADEIIGQSLSLLVPQDHPDELPNILEKMRRGERIEHFETVRMRKDGTRVDVSLTISPVVNSEGKIIGISKTARDITARKEEERRKNEFLAILAHELRNPLAPLRSGLEILRHGGDDRETLEQVRSMMERQLQNLVRLVDDLLDVSRIRQGKLQLRVERSTVQELVNAALEMCRETVHKQGNTVEVQLPAEPMYVQADKTRLSQSLCNLLTNAAKFSEPGDPIVLAGAVESNQVVIRVKDRGIGIPPHMLSRVFEMFTQVDRTLEKSRGGLGVGLSIVKQLIEMHYGTVEAHSAGNGHGSEFIIRLPLDKRESATKGTQESAHANVETPQSMPRCRILVADDNADSAKSLALMLEMMGHEVRTAHDGLEGIEVAKSFQPEIVFLDIGMPNLNGYDACRQMRQLPAGNNMLIVALTGWGQEEDKRRSTEAGFDLHLIKPVEPSALRNLLSRFVGGEFAPQRQR